VQRAAASRRRGTGVRARTVSRARVRIPLSFLRMPETVFTKVDYQLASLVDDIELGEIGLPDIQRPFVWETAKVRDLFDSMYRATRWGDRHVGNGQVVSSRRTWPTRLSRHRHR
jgi:hypothetical protein